MLISLDFAEAQRSIRIRTRRAGSGSRIKIGVFLDEDCSVCAEFQDVEDYLKDDDGYPMKLSYHLGVLRRQLPPGRRR